jgi:hypothetical protein
MLGITPRRISRAIVLALLAAAPMRATGGQSQVARADSLLRRGRVFAAESLYYTAVRREPRDPAARLALGRYHAARGALRVGAVLMEEARFFGGDANTVARELAPVYARLGDYRALASLPGSPLSAADRSRTDWLKSNPPASAGPDSVTVPYLPADSQAVGSMRITVGDDTVDAVIDPAVRGLVLDSAWVHRKETRPFRTNGDARVSVGVAQNVSIGALGLTNMPVQYASLGGAKRARIGLDVLGDLTATIDPAARTVTLRRGLARTPRSAPSAGDRIPTLALPTGLYAVGSGALDPLAGPSGRARLRGAAWTVSSRRGEIVVAR